MNPFIDGTPKYPNKHTEELRDAAEEAYQGSGKSADDVEDNRDHKTEKSLDKGLKETFPASDPVSHMPGAD